MFDMAYKVARVWGIPIKIHISLVVVLGLLTAAAVRYEGWTAALWIAAFYILLFSSVALHELGHSLVALRKGCRVREITLTMIGGVAQMERIPRRPADEILMAAAGPLVSVVLGVALIRWGGLVPWLTERWPVPVVGDTQLTLLQYLGVVNLGLAALNLLPCFPMDGGRIFRAALTRRLGRVRATGIAMKLGQVLAVGMGVYGFWGGGVGSPLGRNWVLVAIAFFVFIAGTNEYRGVLREARMRGGDGADRVIISPPPYAPDDEEQEADIGPADRGPFGGRFGR